MNDSLQQEIDQHDEECAQQGESVFLAWFAAVFFVCWVVWLFWALFTDPGWDYFGEFKP